MRNEALTLAALLAVIAPGCGGGERPGAAGGSDAGELERVPPPALEAMDPAVRTQLEQAREELDRLLERGRSEELGTAFGRLGRLYHAYGLEELAAVSYRNAERLAPAEPRWRYYLGILAAEAGDFEDAAARFGRVLEDEAAYVPAAIHQGNAWLELGETERARRAFERAAERPDLRAAAEAGLGRAARRAGDLEAAVRHLRAALEAQPEALRLHHQMMLVLRDLGEMEAARQHAAQAGASEVAFPDPWLSELRTEVEGAEFYLRSAGMAFMQGRFGVAAQEYRRAVERAPESPRAHQGLASALLELGDLQGALKHYREALRVAPENALSHFNLGVALRRSGGEEAAAEHFRRALELDPDLLEARMHLASLALDAGRNQEALEAFESLLRDDPNHRGARAARPVALWRLGRREEALREAHGVIAADPQNQQARLNLAALLVEAGHLEEADRELVGVLESDAERELEAQAHLNRALIAERRGAVGEALGYLRRAVEVAPGLVEARSRLAGALARGGHYGEAAEHYRRVAEVWQDRPQAWLMEGTALVLSGRDREARERLEEAVRRFADEPQLALALAKLLAASSVAEVRDGGRALDLARAAHRLRPGIESAETLAMAHAELGDFTQAVAWQERAVELARDAGLQGLPERLEAWLQAYRRGEPCREPWQQR